MDFNLQKGSSMVGTLVEIAAPLLKILIEQLEKAKVFTRRKEVSEEHFGTVSKLLSGRLVYLLRYMDNRPDPVYPRAFGRVLASFVEVERTRQPARFELGAEEAWDKASQYACWYLSMLGLVSVWGGIGDEVAISELGKRVIRSDSIRTTFREAFMQPLP
jgi:hypothetical protein